MLEYLEVGAGSMEIICPSCGIKYRIRDEKIRGKTVKMTCRKCEASVYIRDPALGEPFVFLGRPPEVVARKKAVGAKVSQRGTKSVKIRWYALHEGNRTGPFGREKILEKLKNGEITPKTLMWKPGLPKWKRAERIDDFQPLLQEFQQWIESQEQERTIVSKIPLPARETSSVEFPPIPEEALADAPVPSVPSNVRQESHSEISSVSNFFGTARVAAVSEAEIRASTERFKSGIERLDPSDMHEIAASPEEKKFFTKVFQAKDLPVHQEEDPLEKIAAEKVAPRKETLREFSVLMRIEQNTKKRNRIYAATGIILIALVVGLTIFLSAIAPKSHDLVLPDQESGGKFKIHEYTVIPKPKTTYKSFEKRTQPEIIREPVARHKKHPDRARPRHNKKKRGMPSPKNLALAKQYHSLFLNSGNIGEAAVQVKKNTVASMPKITLDSNGMNKFLQGKTKRLVACSRRKSYLQGQTVKVMLQFTVMDTGKVSYVKISQPDGLDDPGLFGCIKQMVRGWVFPKKAGRKPLSFGTTLLL